MGATSGVYTFRTRVSDDLHLAMGIPKDSRRASGFPWHEYRFGCPREEALRLYRKGHRKAPDREEGKKALPDTLAPPTPLRNAPQALNRHASALGKRSGEVRAENSKATAPGGLTWTEYNKRRKHNVTRVGDRRMSLRRFEREEVEERQESLI